MARKKTVKKNEEITSDNLESNEPIIEKQTEEKKEKIEIPEEILESIGDLKELEGEQGPEELPENMGEVKELEVIEDATVEVSEDFVIKANELVTEINGMFLGGPGQRALDALKAELERIY